MTNLDEFVSDYLDACASSDGVKPTARQIAVAYADHELPEPCTDAEFAAKVEEVTPQVEYYL